MSVVTVTCSTGIRTTLWNHAPVSLLLACGGWGSGHLLLLLLEKLQFLLLSTVLRFTSSKVFASLHPWQMSFLLQLLTPQPEDLLQPVSCGSCVWHLGRQTCACCAMAVIYVHAGFLSAENPGKARAGYLTFGVLRGLWELIRASRLVTQWMTQFLISRSCQWNGTD